MTQNKNKKGIAKKALSISLVAAMLATSNVPVWASGFTAENFDAEPSAQGHQSAALRRMRIAVCCGKTAYIRDSIHTDETRVPFNHA